MKRGTIALLALVWSIVGLAGEETFRGAKINYENAEVSWPDGKDQGDIVFTFKYGETPGYLTLPGPAKAWVLSVGGGGAGGSSSSAGTGVGVGGGGGAGGFVEVKDILLESGEYQIKVGAGGEPGEDATDAAGGDGDPSKLFYVNGELTEELTAYTAGGGGGGGGHSPGRSGASGGGGSMVSSASQSGGAAIYGDQGKAGGVGSFNNAAGGGGGADMAGGATVAAQKAGNGGDGKPSAIACADGADPIYYAGGGGGGVSSGSNMGLGGLGNGPANSDTPYGKGGGGSKGTGSVPQPGADGYGGGGGGGTQKLAGGAGGSGVIIIRLSDVLAGDPVKPVKPAKSPAYTGKKIVVVPESMAYELTGDGYATEVGTYSVTVTLKTGFKWSDGTRDVVSFDWEITPRYVEVPVAPDDLVYNGENQLAIYSPDPAFDFAPGSVTNATNVGTYRYTVSLKDENCVWLGATEGHERDGREVVWQIAPKPVTAPVAPSGLTYNKANQIALTQLDDCFTLAEGSVTNATNAGSYHYTLALKNDNYVWKGAAEGHEHDALTVDWKIAPQHVTMPAVITDLVYNGEYQDAIDFEEIDEEIVEVVEDEEFVASAKDAGDYRLCLRLKNEDADNYAWWIDSHEIYAEQIRDWSIAPADNKITSLVLAGWKVYEGAKGNDPVATAMYGQPAYTYAADENAPEEEWAEEKPNVAGTWWVRARVEADRNYAAAEKKLAFVLWDDPEMLFTDHVELTLSGYAGSTTIANLPVLVRISETRLPGFSYDRTGANGEGLAFICGNEMLDYEVDTWNTAGESLVWVRVPEVKGQTTKMTMWWHLRDGQLGPGSNPRGVWQDYHAVWHFNETISAAAASTTLSVDATGNGYDAQAKNYYSSATVIQSAISVEGLFGNARQTSQTKYSRGPRFEVPSSVDLALGTSFTMSGWFKEGANRDSGSSGNTKILVARKTAQNATEGWYLQLNGTGTANRQDREFYAQGAGSSSVAPAIYTAGSASTFLDTGWIFFAQTFDGASMTVIGGATNVYKTATGSVQAPTDNGKALSFGNFAGDQNLQSFIGAFDEFRLSKTARSADFSRAEFDTEVNPDFVTAGLVVREGLKVNSWKIAPDFQPRSWEMKEGPGEITLDKGKLADGAAVSNYFYSVNDPTVTFTDPTAITQGGLYRAVFVMEDSEGYEPLAYTIDIRVYDHSPYIDLGASAGGRVLLMNDDGGTKGSIPAVDYQGWFDRADRAATVESQTTFWESFGDDDLVDNTYNLKPGTNWVLWTQHRGTPLWYLDNCRHGNTYVKGAATAADKTVMSEYQNYLPWSTTSKRIDESRKRAAVAGSVGQLLMRNVVDAAVYSPCYTNGVGTIYFDIVNGWTGSAGEACQFVVEIATETKDGETLTPENAHRIDGLGNTIWYDNVKEWIPQPAYLARVSNGAMTAPTAGALTNALDITTGGKMTEFYRAYVPLNLPAACFRIRRVSVANGQDEDRALILVDNILVSYPPMRADLTPTGAYDNTRSGMMVLGRECATTVPFPAVGETAAYARAVPVYTVNDALGKPADTNTFVVAARMYYRGRYLNQIVDNWKTADLNPLGGFVSFEPLDLPATVEDVEFWFEAELQAPFFDYVDYSGTGIGMPAYSEEVQTVINHRTETAELPSSGEEWFFRLRNGASNYEGVRAIVEEATTTNHYATVDLELMNDGLWRGVLKTPKAMKDGLKFRLEGVNPQVDGAKSIVVSTNYWCATGDVLDMPKMMTYHKATGTNEWAKLICDAKTGYILFQFKEPKGDDEALNELMVCRADRQDFNLWSSGVNLQGKFVGSALETNTVSYATTETYLNWDEWEPTSAMNANWSEAFTVNAGERADEHYPRNVPFSSARSDNNWTAENALWTWGKWSLTSNFGKDTESQGDDSAVQLEGRGKGSLSFINNVDIPDGLDTITYHARVAQFNEFNDFTYFNRYMISLDEQGKFLGGYPAFDMTDRTFVTLAALSEKGATAYDGDGTVSLVGYYHPQYGCYEVRASRGATDKSARLALYRWSYIGGQMTCENLGFQEFNDNESNGTGANANRLVHTSDANLAGLYLSIKEYNGGTFVLAGFCRKDVSRSLAISAMSGESFASIVYHDTSSSRLKKGTFGVLSRNCPGAFAKPTIFSRPAEMADGAKLPAANKLDRYTNSTITFQGTPDPTSVKLEGGKVADSYYESDWIIPPWRMHKLTGHGEGTSSACWGFQANDEVSQKVVVQIRTRDGSSVSDWMDVITNTVSSFCDSTFSLVVRRPEKCDVRLHVPGLPTDVRTDVVINDVKLTQWNGQWTPNYDSSSYHYLTNTFVYTSGWVSPDGTGKILTLQPTRATYNKNGEWNPVSIRSPLMRGVGLVHFKWKNADTRARYKLQITEKATYSGFRLLTDTPASDESTWETVETLDFSKLGRSGGKTFYINRRYDVVASDREYYKCAVRLVADDAVIDAAHQGSTPKNNPDYGRIDITDAYVWDLPEYDSRSWSGWNFRNSGWDGVKPDSYANLNDGFSGLSGLLNNSMDPSTLACKPNEVEYFASRCPSVQSPTFGTNCVGQLTFRARLYNKSDAATYGHGAVVTVYGATAVNESGEPTKWKEAGDIIVTEPTYSLKSLKFAGVDTFYAIRLGVKGVKGVVEPGEPLYDPPIRVAIDDIVIWEKLPLTIKFHELRSRPFRDEDELKKTTEVKDIDSTEEQPLAGESFGFQAEIVIADDEEILVDDPKHPIGVELCYYPSAEPWGYVNWSNRAQTVRVPLVETTDHKLVFRSSMELSDTLCPPVVLKDGEPYGIVQYHFVAKFYDKQGNPMTHDLSAKDWIKPSWYEGFDDPNAGKEFSAFTLLERLAPKRAWINEVNFCEPKSAESKANQWVELAVPSGVDMTGWKLNVYDYKGKPATGSSATSATIATLGMWGAPAAKTYAGKNPTAIASHYAFYTLGSPNTSVVTDAKWDAFSGSGELNYTMPYAFELVRPSGVIEHRAVVQGWNQAEEDGYWYAYMYSGTNLVETLNAERAGGVKWVWAGEDYHSTETAGMTVGVTNGQGQVHEDWATPLARTPGDINPNQYIDPNWFTTPNGGYVWIYSSVVGDHMRQIIGGETNTVASFTIAQGRSTNIVFEVDRWYKLGTCERTPADRTLLSEPVVKDGKSYYTLSMGLISNRIDIVSSATISDEVAKMGLDPNDAYAPAVMNWLERGVTGGADGGIHPFKGTELKQAYYRGNNFSEPLTDKPLDIIDMYWLDIDPTDGNWELWGGMGEPFTGQALGQVDEPIIRKLKDVTPDHTNQLTTVWMMMTNVVDGTSYAPYRLQGVGGEQSDSYIGVWTSANFKVTMRLANGKVDDIFQPMRSFVFNWGSFRQPYSADPEDQRAPFCARVEITDPFSRQSPAWEWGWWKYSDNNKGTFTGWDLSRSISPAGVSTLKKNDLLEW